MATPTFKIEIDYDNKTCTVTDLNPQGTTGTLTVEGNPGFDETFTIDIAGGNTSVTFDLPLVNGDIEEASYLFLYENAYFSPTGELQKTVVWTNPTLPTISIAHSHSCELLTYHVEDTTSYAIAGYTLAFTRVMTLTPPPLSGITPVTVTDTESAVVGEINTEGGILTGIFETGIAIDLVYSKTDYSFSTSITGALLDNITCSLHGTTTVDAMADLVDEYNTALTTNYAIAQAKLSLLTKVMSEQMLYSEYLRLGNLTKAGIHSENMKTLLNVSDE